MPHGSVARGPMTDLMDPPRGLVIHGVRVPRAAWVSASRRGVPHSVRAFCGRPEWKGGSVSVSFPCPFDDLDHSGRGLV